MGNYILCQVKRAKTPYYIEHISLNIYSIEELCYYIMGNLPLLDESILNKDLADWLNQELHLRRLAQKLYEVLELEDCSVNDVIVPILKEINYLDNNQFRELDLRLQAYDKLPTPVKEKRKGDALVAHCKYIKAIETYASILQHPWEDHLGEQFTGTIHNNMGCAYSRLFQMEEACECFRQAYEELHSMETLQSYLYAVYMKDGEDAFLKRCNEMGIDDATREDMEGKILKISGEDVPEDMDKALSDWTYAYHRNTGM